MKNLQRGFVVPLLITIIALLIVGGGTYVYLNHSENPKQNINQNLPSTPNITSNTLVDVPATDLDKVKNFVKTSIEKDRELTNRSLSCLSITDIDTFPNSQPIQGQKDYQVLEVHNSICGGDPSTKTRLFNVRLYTKTGEMSIYAINTSR